MSAPVAVENFGPVDIIFEAADTFVFGDIDRTVRAWSIASAFAEIFVGSFEIDAPGTRHAFNGSAHNDLPFVKSTFQLIPYFIIRCLLHQGKSDNGKPWGYLFVRFRSWSILFQKVLSICMKMSLCPAYFIQWWSFGSLAAL